MAERFAHGPTVAVHGRTAVASTRPRPHENARMPVLPFDLRPEQVRAAAVLGVPLLLALGLWVFALVGSDAPGTPDVAAVDDTEDGDAGAVDDGAADGGTADGGTADGEGTGADASDPAVAGGPVTVDFDQVCEVELDPAEHEDPRPWDFPDCERAPIALEGTQTQWVVVVASLWGADFSETQALARLDERGRGELLWSTHYPSLNPGLWVVVEGPFPDQDTADEAADELGNGAYARALSDDEGDRYCIADDGCVGERVRAEESTR